jgi:DNA modification methylase
MKKVKMKINKLGSGSGVCPLAYNTKSKRTDEAYPSSILEFSREKKLHPTQKPVLLLQYLIKTYTKENETVLDNCMGSGSTGVACHYLNRKFIGIEKDEKYFAIACKRVQNPEQNPKPISKAGNIFAE